MIHRQGMCALQERFLYSCLHLPLSIFYFHLPLLFLFSPALIISFIMCLPVTQPILPFSSPMSSGLPGHSPAQELPFSQLSVWSDLLALPSAVTNTDQGSKGQDSPCIHIRLVLSLLSYCSDSASRNGLSWIFLSFLSMWSYYHTRLINVCVPIKMLWDKMCY